MEPLSLAALATSIFGIIKPIIKTKPGKELTAATKGSMTELWGKVKHWFIIEEKEIEELKDLKENPEDKDFEEAFITKLKTKLKKDDNLRTEIEDFLSEKEKSNEQISVIIKNSKNVMTGNISNVTGSIHLGDNK